jgi:acyl-coenzyme A thioesterase PaaI-like protein
MPESLQKTYGQTNICFGCGVDNPHGLHLESTPEGEDVIATWMAQKHHEAFPGVLSGGIIGTLLDCHGVWTTAYTMMKRQNLPAPPSVVTAEFSIGLKRPTPTNGPIHLRAKVVEMPSPERAVVEGTLEAAGKVCATLRGTFVAVKPGHPAYHRW